MRRVMIAVSALVAVLGTAWYGLHFIPADFGYTVEAEFTAVPVTDDPLAEWLRVQPGVYSSAVERQQIGERWRLVVWVGITRNGWGEPPFPDLESKCSALGYRGQAGKFRDRPFQ